jgi:hypothetical protein
MSSTVPSTRSQIKDAVTRDFKSWLFEARNESRNVGRLALEAMEQRNRRWKARKAKDTDGTLRLARVGSPIECGTSERHESELSVCLLTAPLKTTDQPVREKIMFSRTTRFISTSSRYINAFTRTTPSMPEKNSSFLIRKTAERKPIFSFLNRRPFLGRLSFPRFPPC